MSRLALGTVQFGLPYGIANRAGQVSRPEAKAMLDLAAANGIDTLDTAIAYGDSEARLGELGTANFKLVTKLPALPDDCPDVGAWVLRQVDASMARLGTTCLHGLLLHRAEDLLGRQGRSLSRALLHLKECGRVRKLGVSVYGSHDLETINDAFPLDLVQAPLNLVDQRLVTSGWMKRLHADGVEIHTRSAFLQGLLLMPRAAIPPQFAPWSQLWERWHRWLARQDVTAVQACLAFPLSFPEIYRVVAGAENARQLAQVVEAAKGSQPVVLPDLRCDAAELIDPSRWARP